MNLSDILLILGLAAGGFSVYLLTRVVLGDKVDKNSLAWATGDEPAVSKSPIVNYSRPIVHNFTLSHAKKIKAPSYREKIEQLIKTAGIKDELNVDEFIGMQILWGLMFPAFLFIFNFALSLEISPALILILGGAGFFFPNMYANGEKKRRNLSIQIDLPFFIDLLALTTEAGMDFMGAIGRIVEKAPESDLAEELKEMLAEIRVGSSREEALRNLADRVELSEIMSLVAVVVDADRTGVPIHTVLKDQADQIRLERFVKAEKAGAKASQSMMIPLVLFIVPAVFLVVLAPVGLKMF